MTKHSNVSIFVPHIGCPNKCAFCDQHVISGAQKAPNADDVRRICEQAANEISDRKNAEIAFFGGSFTAIPRSYMTELLEATKGFVGESGFKGIRISTRPDCIDREILEILKKYGVTAIELGAQSMSDEVLTANDRGHNAQSVADASRLIKEFGFELGLQMMMGLYKSSEQKERETLRRIIALRPDTVRIYPVVVLEGTKLAELYRSGEYELMPFEKIVSLCAEFLDEFEEQGIRVIKCGLHASDGVDGERIAGYYHPAFRELCESERYRKLIEDIFAEEHIVSGNVTLSVAAPCISRAAGHKKCNTEYFRNKGINITFVGDDGQTEKIKVKERR